MILVILGKICEWDRWALKSSLIVCMAPLMSLANVIANKKEVIANDVMHPMKRSGVEIAFSCMRIAKKYPIGFLQSNGNLNTQN